MCTNLVIGAVGVDNHWPRLDGAGHKDPLVSAAHEHVKTAIRGIVDTVFHIE
jgi:hypothetical protein